MKIKDALPQVHFIHTEFYHRCVQLTAEQLEAVLRFGMKRGYTTTHQITNFDVDRVLTRLQMQTG